jgi:F-box protein 18 (helicase)
VQISLKTYTHQQIYSWRYAINSLDQVDFTKYELSQSFRFGGDIAHLAKEVLKWKAAVMSSNDVSITGLNNDTKQTEPKAVLARTNLGLLYQAISYTAKFRDSKKIHFEGNIQNYTYAEEGTSLYDVLYLYLAKKEKIRSKMIKAMSGMYELEDYADKTEDKQIKMMIDLVKEYSSELFDIINSLKRLHVENKKDADMIFSTVHRAKGMEYDSVILADDFLNERDVKKNVNDASKGIVNVTKVIEEVNLLYVAVTRAKTGVHIHQELLPHGFPKSPFIHPLQLTSQVTTSVLSNSLGDFRNAQYEQFQSGKPKAKNRADEELTNLYMVGFTEQDIAVELNLSDRVVKEKIKKLGLKRENN